MKTYSKEQLADYAVGVFAEHKSEKYMYCDEQGNWKTQSQYDALSSEDQNAYFRFENKKHEVVLDSVAKLAELEKLVENLKEANQKLAEQLAELKGKSGAAVEPLKEENQNLLSNQLADHKPEGGNSGEEKKPKSKTKKQ